MFKFFFHGYGCWFFKHRNSRITYSILSINGSSLLSPCVDGDANIKNSFKSLGCFHLQREYEYSYQKTKSILNINRLEPCQGYDPISTFPKITENLLIGMKSVLAEDCYFLIDMDKPYDLVPDSVDKPCGNCSLSMNNDSSPDKTSIKKRHGKNMNMDSLVLLYAALDEIEQNTGNTPTCDELALHVLSSEFKHQNIHEILNPDAPIKRRELKLSDGKTIDYIKIKRTYKEVIFSKYF